MWVAMMEDNDMQNVITDKTSLYNCFLFEDDWIMETDESERN